MAPVIGILGGGQLARMSVLAAASYGVSVHIFDPDPHSPAAIVAARHVCAPWSCEQSLKDFAASVDSVSCEFENIPIATLQFLDTITSVVPHWKSLEIAQDREREKMLARELDIPTTAFICAQGRESVLSAVTQLGGSVRIKTCRMGYDGKGQYGVNGPEDASSIPQSLLDQRVLIERSVNFSSEISVVLARTAQGDMTVWPVGWNEHREGILHKTHVPAPVSPSVCDQAITFSRKIAAHMDYVGILATEWFVLEDESILFNEMAPRPHNSGHWTIDFSTTSQFAQWIRILCRWPLGASDLLHPCVMTNILGADITATESLMRESPSTVHIYSKKDARPRRKMGHKTRKKL